MVRVSTCIYTCTKALGMIKMARKEKMAHLKEEAEEQEQETKRIHFQDEKNSWSFVPLIIYRSLIEIKKERKERKKAGGRRST